MWFPICRIPRLHSGSVHLINLSGDTISALFSEQFAAYFFQTETPSFWHEEINISIAEYQHSEKDHQDERSNSWYASVWPSRQSWELTLQLSGVQRMTVKTSRSYQIVNIPEGQHIEYCHYQLVALPRAILFGRTRSGNDSPVGFQHDLNEGCSLAYPGTPIWTDISQNATISDQNVRCRSPKHREWKHMQNGKCNQSVATLLISKGQLIFGRAIRGEGKMSDKSCLWTTST